MTEKEKTTKLLIDKTIKAFPQTIFFIDQSSTFKIFTFPTKSLLGIPHQLLNYNNFDALLDYIYSLNPKEQIVERPMIRDDGHFYESVDLGRGLLMIRPLKPFYFESINLDPEFGLTLDFYQSINCYILFNCSDSDQIKIEGKCSRWKTLKILPIGF